MNQSPNDTLTPKPVFIPPRAIVALANLAAILSAAVDEHDERFVDGR